MGLKATVDAPSPVLDVFCAQWILELTLTRFGQEPQCRMSTRRAIHSATPAGWEMKSLQSTSLSKTEC